MFIEKLELVINKLLEPETAILEKIIDNLFRKKIIKF
jgi:hypothetical protein